jgi:predicted HTH domain antitoxin
METVTARLPEEVIKTLELLAKEEQIDRSELIRRILDVGIQEFLMERALKAYRKREVSLWKAAEMAKVSLRKMIEAADKALIPISYDLDDLERDLAFARTGKSD